MGKRYIRKRISLTKGGGATFSCTNCPFEANRKDQMKQHLADCKCKKK